MSEKVSKRLAVQNLDWDQINSKDLFAIFTSLCKEGQKIEKVEIYPSEFGKEQMKKDTLYGPTGIWKSRNSEQQQKSDTTNQQKIPENSEDESSENDDPLKKEEKVEKSENVEEKDKNSEKDAENSEEDSENDDPLKEKAEPIEKPLTKREIRIKEKGFDPLALRKYELQKLRYFYAVIYCDSIATASHLYDEYDGFEYENSAFKLDLRFVPDEVIFPDKPKEVCTKNDPNYKPKLEIVNSALQSSQVRLTWEAPNPKRFEVIHKNLDPEKLEEMDLKDYLGSESESEEKEENENEEELAKKMEKYKKLLSFNSEENPTGSKKNKAGDDLQITFTNGLEEEEEQKEPQKEEWAREKHSKKGKQKFKDRKRKEAEIPDKSMQELELLVDSKNPADNFKVDLGDERFGALYKDKRYLIDPSSKDYKKASKEIRTEQLKKKKIENPN